MANTKVSGIDLIATERKRQVSEEGYDAKHDKEHKAGELALAACCYAAPQPIFTCVEYANGTLYRDPWPWLVSSDKREYDGNIVMNPAKRTKQERIYLLIKAGALIAAEIDRLQNK